MVINVVTVGMLMTNCYIAMDEKTKDAIVIDPGARAEKIIAAILDASGRGIGTREQCMAAAIYSINNETYPMVQETMKKFFGLTIEELLKAELSEYDAKDLYRHLNQFKK